MVIVLSGQIHYLRNRSKIVNINIDMNHHKSKTQGIICMPTVKDSTKSINSFLFTSFLYAVMSKLPPPTLIITDNHRYLFSHVVFNILLINVFLSPLFRFAFYAESCKWFCCSAIE